MDLPAFARDQINAAAAPLDRDRREAFTKAVLDGLQGQPIGAGTVHRAIAATQRAFYDPPTFNGPGSEARYAKYR
jgi:hypothetical protein